MVKSFNYCIQTNYLKIRLDLNKMILKHLKIQTKKANKN